MKDYDERQYHDLGKSATAAYGVMFIVCVISIIVQLIGWNGNLKMVIGENLAMIAGGVIFLTGAIKSGCFSFTGRKKDKRAGVHNIVLSLLMAAIADVVCGLIIRRKSGSDFIHIGKYLIFVFVLITVLCFIILSVLELLSDRSEENAEKAYADEKENVKDDTDTMMDQEVVCLAVSSVEANMLIDILKENEIPAFKKSMDGGIMSVYSGNSNQGEYIYVARINVKRAKEILDEYTSIDR